MSDMVTHDGDEIAAPASKAAGVEVASAGAIASIQAQATLAKRFPRDETAAHTAIIRACKRVGLAEVAQYAFPRGDSTVTGPSIRLAEALALSWGNILFGWSEVEQRRGQSTICGWAWDLQTNVRRDLTCIVRHERHTKTRTYALTDPRDIYEMCANQAQRRVRSSILAIIPGDIIEAALEQCDKTLKDAGKGVSILDRVRKIAASFDDYGVTLPMIEKRLGHTINTITETEIVGLRKIYNSIKDNMADPFSFFDRGDAPPPETGVPGKGAAGLKQTLTRDQPPPPASGPPITDATKDAIENLLENAPAETWMLALNSVKPQSVLVDKMTEDEGQRIVAAIHVLKQGGGR